MYDYHLLLSRHFLSSPKGLFIFVAFTCLVFIAITQEKARLYIAINISPIEVQANYYQTIEHENPIVDKVYQYSFEEKAFNYTLRLLTRYPEDAARVDDTAPLRLSISGLFPDIAVESDRLYRLQADAHIFYIAVSVLILCVLAMLAYFLKKFRSNNKSVPQ